MLENLYKLTPDQWSAIGQWVGAIGTILAVVVSLKLARDAKLYSAPKLKISERYVFAQDIEYPGQVEKMEFTATNIGQVPIILTDCYIRMSKVKPQSENFISLTNSSSEKDSFPIKIDPSYSAKITIEVSKLIRLSKISTKKNDTFEIFMVDGINNLYSQKFLL